MDQSTIQLCGDELFEALQASKSITPLTERYPEITIDDAYHISLRFLERRVAAGAHVIGKKIGITSKAVQQALKVDQPDFGFLTDDMAFSQGEEMPISGKLIAPKAEGEVAFVLEKDLLGPGITNARRTRGHRFRFTLL